MRVRYLSVVRCNSRQVTGEVVLAVLTLTLPAILASVNWIDAVLYK
jgi:hypothetical protein